MTYNNAEFLYAPIWGSKFKVRGIPDKDGMRFQINLVHHLSQQCIFHTHIYYKPSKIVFDSMNINNHWQKIEETLDIPIQAGIEFEVEVTCNKEEYTITINKTWTQSYKHRQNYLHADRLVIIGHVVLLEVTPNVITTEPCNEKIPSQ